MRTICILEILFILYTKLFYGFRWLHFRRTAFIMLFFVIQKLHSLNIHSLSLHWRIAARVFFKPYLLKVTQVFNDKRVKNNDRISIFECTIPLNDPQMYWTAHIEDPGCFTASFWCDSLRVLKARFSASSTRSLHIFLTRSAYTLLGLSLQNMVDLWESALVHVRECL